jgi:hypothetical protein
MNKEELIKQVQELEKALEAKKAEIESLKQRLIEKDSRIEELEGQFAYECECNKQFVECQKENEELKQQLAEKDNEHTKEMMAFEKKCQAYYNSKGFAIEQLEKVKEEFNSRKLEYKSCTTGNHCYGLRIDRINELIDNQIEELKKEKRNESNNEN